MRDTFCEIVFLETSIIVQITVMFSYSNAYISWICLVAFYKDSDYISADISQE